MNTAPVLGEFVGTAVLVLLGDGIVAGVIDRCICEPDPVAMMPPREAALREVGIRYREVSPRLDIGSKAAMLDANTRTH